MLIKAKIMGQGYGVKNPSTAIQTQAADSIQAIMGLFISILLSGCVATNPPLPTEVKVLVISPCLTRSQIPAQDFMPDSELAKLDDFELVLQLRSEQLKQRVYIGQVAPLLEACVTP